MNEHGRHGMIGGMFWFDPIPVTDRLPEVGCYLAYVVRTQTPARWECAHYNENGWLLRGRATVTHWLPLPPIPTTALAD